MDGRNLHPRPDPDIAVAVPSHPAQVESVATQPGIIHRGQPAAVPAPAATDFSELPAWVWRVFVGVWLVFLGALWIRFAGGAHSAFMVAITSAFALIYFTLPWLMIGLRKPLDAALNGTRTRQPPARAKTV